MRKTLNLLMLVILLALASGAVSAQEATDSARSHVALLELHDGYWVAEMQLEGMPVPANIINDMHIDATTRTATVYAQSRVMGRILSPAQVGPGECAETPSGDTACFHPNAVYLNGSGAELTEADGRGAWWVKHAWILGGEGYLNCELGAQEEYESCMWVKGALLDDGISMKVGGIEEGQGFNIRTPLLDEDPVTYQVTRYGSMNADANAGATDQSLTVQFVLTFACAEEVSALDNQARSCPGDAESASDSPATNMVPEITQSQFLAPPADLRNYRYCEVIPVFRTRLTLNVEVYNTLGLNACPAELWAELDADAMAESLGAVGMKLNGPRYWVINKIAREGESAAGKTADFGGIEMTLGPTIDTEHWEGTFGSAFHTETGVRRSTTFTYSSGSMVYELTSPQGDVYRMQSYSHIVDPRLTIDDLETLGERLDLPEGWSYQARVLTEDSKLTARGLAYVINDNLSNVYQKVLD